MNKITGLSKEKDKWTITVQPGLSLKELREAVEKGQIMRYLDPSFKNHQIIDKFLKVYRDFFILQILLRNQLQLVV